MKNKKSKKNLNLEMVEGIVQGHRDGHGFVLRDDAPDLYIPAHVMQTVLHGDRVKAVISGYDRKGRPEGQIMEIISRDKRLIIGRLLQEHGVWLVAPEDVRYKQDIIIPEKGLANAKAGQVVTVELIERPTLHSQPLGRIIEILGEIDDPGMEIEIAVRKYNVPHVFSDETLRAAQALPDTVLASDKRDRVDLTDIPFVTIDGEDARDFDDAVYCTPAAIDEAQGYRLLVAIADVSHYVQPESAIDEDAYERATSVYFPRRVIPMLPEKLSNGLCSLNPDVDRLCLVCDMLITPQGETHAYQFYPAVIRSHARLTYTEVAAIIINPKGPEAQVRAGQVTDLLHLNDVYHVLRQAREQRGALDLDTTETRIVYDEATGKIERIEPYERNDAHRLIEEAMLVANVCAADFIETSKCISLFRVHEGPTPEKQELLQNFLRAAGLSIVVSEDPTPKEFQQIIASTKGRADAQQIQTMLLRSMQQAIYTPENKGHFGLAYAAYTHFTSPIRRYPDLLVHRVIHGILSAKKYMLENRADRSNLTPVGSKTKNEAEQQNKSAVTVKPKVKSKDMQAWEVAGIHCSANERRADEASRDVLAWLKCTYIREHLGEEFAGTVTAVTSFGLFVQLNDLYVEGLVHISELGSDYYQYDELRHELVGERQGMRYGLGTPLHVLVSNVDLDGRRIDFLPVQPEGESLGKPSRFGSGGRFGKGSGNGKSTNNGKSSSRKIPAADMNVAVKRAVQQATKAAKKHKPSKVSKKKAAK